MFTRQHIITFDTNHKSSFNAVLAPTLPELKIVRHSDTMWLSHELCVQAIYQELPALIITLQHLYETSDGAEAYGLSTLLATYTGVHVASFVFLSEVLDILAKRNECMQRKLVDFRKLPVLVKVTTDQFKHLKKEESEWLSSVE